MPLILCHSYADLQEPSQKNLSHVFMHLTNYSLNVHSGNFVHSDSQNTGSKRTLSSVLYRLAAKGVDIKKVWSDIIALVIKTVIAVVPELKVYYQADIPPGKPGPTCFQVSGNLQKCAQKFSPWRCFIWILLLNDVCKLTANSCSYS